MCCKRLVYMNKFYETPCVLVKELTIPLSIRAETHFLKLLRTPGIVSTKSLPCEKSISSWNRFSAATARGEVIEEAMK